MKKNTYLSQFLKTNANLLSILKNGDLVEAELMRRAPRAVYFNLGSFGTGMVYGVELANAANIIREMKVGGKVPAKVVDLENERGYVELSLAAAGRQKAWQEIKELQEKGEIFVIKPISANSGGLIAKINELGAFLPVSQLAGEHYPRVDDGDRAKILGELKKLVGQELKVKILDVNPRSHKLIISEKETSAVNVKELLAKYKVGDIVDGIISGVADFGAFIKFADYPEIEGLIHISELDHRLIESPKEVVKVDDAVKAKIMEIKDGRVSLSLKALKPDPWLKAEEKYQAGQEVRGTVTRFNPYGAFISLDPEIQGLIHVSEFGDVEEMQKKLQVGQSYTFVIDSVKAAEKRIILKLKK